MELAQASALSTAQLSMSGPRGLLINSVTIDNTCNQWLCVIGTNRYIPPYTLGEVVALAGLGALTIQPQAPPTVIQSAVIAGETYSAIVSDQFTPSRPGVSVQEPAAPTQLYWGQYINNSGAGALAGYAPGAKPIQSGRLVLPAQARQWLIAPLAANAGTIYITGRLASPIITLVQDNTTGFPLPPPAAGAPPMTIAVAATGFAVYFVNNGDGFAFLAV